MSESDDAGGYGPDEYLRFFPYEEPYPNQREAMTRVSNALSRGQDVLMEGAPGTGKTLSALVPALEHARQEDRTVVITTNVHQQMRQFVEDARAIADEADIRAVVFRGKSSMCHIDVDYQECQTLRDTTRELVDAEKDRAELERRQRELLDRARDAGAVAAAEGDSVAGEGDGGAGEGGPQSRTDGDAEGAGTIDAPDPNEALAAREAVVNELEDVEDRIDDVADANVCDYYYNNLTADTDEFFAWLYEDVRTPDEIYEYAEERGLCGYELLKEGMEAVDLVVCNYHHLLDPTIREQFFRWLDREPERIVTVFDEAHNVEEAARDHATRTLTENTLDSALAELEDADDSRAGPARNVLATFRDALVDTYDGALAFGERERVDDDWYDLAVANDDRRDDLTLAFLERYEGRGIREELELAVQLGRRLDEEYEKAYRTGEATARKECQTLQAAEFVETWIAAGDELGQHPVVSVRRDAGTDELYGRAELYTCIPRAVTESLFGEVYASVLMSATLRPFDVTEDVLGLDNTARLAYELSYPEENRRTYAVKTPALFASDRGDAEVQRTVGDLLADVVRVTPGNALLFFPSYSEAERYHDRLARGEFDVQDLGGAELYLDEPATRAEDMRAEFVERDDAALFTSLWGTLAEGVSFDGDDARTVAVVGVPYPHLSERLEAVEDAYDRVYDDREGAGWRYAVEIPTVRKTRQALGRVVRGPEDYAVRILADKRYTRADMGRYSVRETFPPEEREELIDIAPEKLKFAMLNFFGDHDAYAGTPPEP